MKCGKESCDRTAEPGQKRCPVHRAFAPTGRKPKRDTRETGHYEGDGLCSSCGERRGWHAGLCRQCLGAA